MTPPISLTDLADRVSRLTGPCRETDGDIALALSLHPAGWRRGVKEASATAIWFNDKTGQSWSSPSLTGSLDAAMTLVPEGEAFLVVRSTTAACWAEVGENEMQVGAETPALALTVAALRLAAKPSDPDAINEKRVQEDAKLAGNVLDARQRVVIEWGERCFGADHMRDKIVRAARFFEEAAELVQSIGLPRDHAMRAFNHVYSREVGEPAQEAGGVANTLMALCGALGLSLDKCQQAEITRCLAKTPEYFAKRNEVKLREVDAALSTGEPKR